MKSGAKLALLQDSDLISTIVLTGDGQNTFHESPYNTGVKSGIAEVAKKDLRMLMCTWLTQLFQLQCRMCVESEERGLREREGDVGELERETRQK